MPLLVSPIDRSPMKQIHRYGIEIDVCPSTRGIWLDKGELEKLMALMQEEISAEIHYAQKPHKKQVNARYSREDDWDDDDDYLGHKSYYKGQKIEKRKSGFSRVMDVFDF
jgi:uncharacterized protein